MLRPALEQLQIVRGEEHHVYLTEEFRGPPERDAVAPDGLTLHGRGEFHDQPDAVRAEKIAGDLESVGPVAGQFLVIVRAEGMADGQEIDRLDQVGLALGVPAEKDIDRGEKETSARS